MGVSRIAIGCLSGATTRG